jgi:hypothetical protein
MIFGRMAASFNVSQPGFLNYLSTGWTRPFKSARMLGYIRKDNKRMVALPALP